MTKNRKTLLMLLRGINHEGPLPNDPLKLLTPLERFHARLYHHHRDVRPDPARISGGESLPGVGERDTPGSK